MFNKGKLLRYSYNIINPITIISVIVSGMVLLYFVVNFREGINEAKNIFFNIMIIFVIALVTIDAVLSNIILEMYEYAVKNCKTINKFFKNYRKTKQDCSKFELLFMLDDETITYLYESVIKHKKH